MQPCCTPLLLVFLCSCVADRRKVVTLQPCSHARVNVLLLVLLFLVLFFGLFVYLFLRRVWSEFWVEQPLELCELSWWLAEVLSELLTLLACLPQLAWVTMPSVSQCFSYPLHSIFWNFSLDPSSKKLRPVHKSQLSCQRVAKFFFRTFSSTGVFDTCYRVTVLFCY